LGQNGNSLDITFQGRFKSDAPHDRFRNLAWVTGVNNEYDSSYVTGHNRNQARAQWERRDVGFEFTPDVQYAVQ